MSTANGVISSVCIHSGEIAGNVVNVEGGGEEEPATNQLTEQRRQLTG